MKKNKITIVTPSFNQGRFIGDTIRSIWDQEGDFYIEHIIADGGSTDETVRVIKSYESKLKKNEYPIKCKGIDLIWWSKKDDGQADAINKGFEIASGDIIAWLNSDDFYEADALNRVFRYFNLNSDIDLIYGGMNFTDISGLITEEYPKSREYNFWQLQNSCYFFQPSTFFRKKVFKVAGLFDVTLHYAFDYEYWLRIGMNKDLKIKSVNMGVLSNLRTYRSRKTESGFVKQKKEVIRILSKKRLFLNYLFAHSIFIVFCDKMKSFIKLY